MEPALKVGNKRPATDSSFDERMCQLPAKSKKLSTLGEDGCDKLLKAASDRWERRDYDNVGVIDRLRLVDLKQLSQEKRVKYHSSCYSSFTSAFHIATLKGKVESHTDASEEASTSHDTRSSRRSLPSLDKSLCIICQQATKEHLSQILTLPKSEKIMSLAKFDLQMRVRLAAMHDLVAEDCLYHPTCEKRFYRCLEKHMIRRIDTSIAKKVIDDLQSNEYVPVPMNITRNTFCQFAADNIDILEETLDGKDTFHATQMVVFQRSQQESENTCEIPIGKEKSITVPAELNELLDAPKITGRPCPKYNDPVQPQWFEPDKSVDQKADFKDVSWLLARNSSPDSQKILSIVLFLVLNQTKQRLGYCL